MRKTKSRWTYNEHILRVPSYLQAHKILDERNTQIHTRNTSYNNTWIRPYIHAKQTSIVNCIAHAQTDKDTCKYNKILKKLVN